MNPIVILLYCGSSFTRGLYEKLLSLKVAPVMVPSDTPANLIFDMGPSAIIITGSGEYVNSMNAPKVDKEIYQAGIPVLGVCYGMQRMTVDLGGKVGKMATPERGLTKLDLTDEPSLLYGEDFIDNVVPTWMAHNCKVHPRHVPENFVVTGSTDETEVASFEDADRGLYGVQYHPEHIGKDISSQAGTIIITNFLRNVCGLGEPAQ